MAEPNAVQKRKLAKLGMAMPDGSYYIRAGSVGASDLDNAINAVGRGEPQSSHDAIRVHIMKRAKDLGLSDKIPADWNSDGSLKHGQTIDDFLQHFGVLGMRWGHHLPGVEALGGPGNGGPAPFIQPGDHTGGKPGNSGSGDQNNNPLMQQAQGSLDALKALHDRVAQATEAARVEAQNTQQAPHQSPAQPQTTAAKAAPAKAKSSLTHKQATAVHQASKKHLAHVAGLHNKAKAAHANHKAAMAKLAKHPHKAQAKRAAHAASKLHAGHMNHLAKTAHQAHARHLAHVAHLKVKTQVSQLTAHDKAALSKLSPTQRSALKKLTPQQRATLNHMTPAQKAKLSHLTQAEKTALSHLSPAQKAALAKATAASAQKRHNQAQGRKAVTNASTAAAKKQTAAAQAARTPAQKAAIAKLRAQSQNGSGVLKLSVDDPVGTFLEHHGVKGMKWGVRRNGGHPGRDATVHPISSDAQKAHDVAQRIRKHGTAALSNEDLQHLVNRQRLLQQHAQLNPADPSSVRKGLEFVKTLSNDTKTVLDAVETGRRAVKTFNGLSSEMPAHKQGRRTRNRPLKVVDIKAA